MELIYNGSFSIVNLSANVESITKFLLKSLENKLVAKLNIYLVKKSNLGLFDFVTKQIILICKINLLKAY